MSDAGSDDKGPSRIAALAQHCSQAQANIAFFVVFERTITSLKEKPCSPFGLNVILR